MRRVLMTIALGVLAMRCGADSHDPSDAGDDRTSTVKPDAVSPKPDAAPRLTAHKGSTLPSMQLGVVYIGEADAGGAPPEDPSIGWILGSPYWLLLDEYGIGNGAVVGSARVPASSFFQSGDLDSNGLVDMVVLQARMLEAIHGDADAGTTSTVSLPGAQAYLVYLPDGVNVTLGHRGTYTYQTCIDSSGYHAFDGAEPYAVMPPCNTGRTLYAISHELAEMATDPQPYEGWVSDTDMPVNGGEVADLCANETFVYGLWLTQLWSNQSGGCVP